MTPPRSDQGLVRIPEAEFEVILAARPRKARSAHLPMSALEGEEAALDLSAVWRGTSSEDSMMKHFAFTISNSSYRFDLLRVLARRLLAVCLSGGGA